jgi:calcineurin-like phosphoesterase family protein
MKRFWTSDSHFLHGKIMKYCNRPFASAEEMESEKFKPESIKAMNEELIRQWNAVVSDEDEVYHLGDVSMGTPSRTLEILYRLNGKIHLIKGNHEAAVLRKQSTRDRFTSIQDVLTIRCEDEDVKGGYQDIFMSHYAHRVWNKSHHGRWHLYGHSHSGLEGLSWGKSMDAGVDAHALRFGNYAPFSYEEIKGILSKRDIKTIDHHQERGGKLVTNK